MGEAVRCGESSTAGGFPSAGDWRTRREVSSVVATAVIGHWVFSASLRLFVPLDPKPSTFYRRRCCNLR